MAKFSEDSPDAIPLHRLGKSWAHVYVDDEGGINVDNVTRSIYGRNMPLSNGLRLSPEKTELLIKALKRAIKEAKRK